MSLVSSNEIAKAIKLDKFGFIGKFIGWLLLKVLRISIANNTYDKNKHLSLIPFLEGVLSDLNVKYEIPEEDFKRLPKEGSYITVSNHPLGGVDGIILLKLMQERVPNYKIIANFLLHRVEPMKPYIMPVNPFEDHKDSKSSVGGVKAALKHIREGNTLGIFPAGEVSSTKEGNIIVDKPWEPGAIKLIKKAGVPVVPIYFHAKNSPLFYLLAKIHPLLRTAKLPSELLSQKRKTVKVRIGKPISVEELNEYENLDDFCEFIRRKTYMLSNAFSKGNKLLIGANFRPQKLPKKIANPSNQDKIIEEVNILKQGDNSLLESKNYQVFLSTAEKIPNILHELGRLREITFRAVGEGTNQSLDLDKYDQYYHHMFLWDNDAQRIAGAYRMGLGNQIYKKFGVEGFYNSELFKFEPELNTFLSETIEMGRAFIISEYQQRPMPLFLLWKGIVHTTLRYPEHKYLMGGVSISNQFSDFSKSLMIEFMRSHYYDAYLAQYIHPRNEFKVKLKDADKDFVLNSTQEDVNKFDKIINEVEPGNLRLPVLIKKYIKQNARVVSFNVDPLFNNAVDGLMYIKISDLPESTVKPVMEEFQKQLEKKQN